MCKVIHVCEAAGPGLDFDYKSHIMFPLTRENWACIRSLDLHSSIQSPSCVQLFVTPWTAARQATLPITNSQSLLKLMSITSVMPYNHLIICRPLFLIPSIFPSIRVFSNKSALCIKWPKYWSFSFNISPSNDYSGLISFRIDWLDLFVVQGSLKSLLQHHSSNALLVVREMQIKTMRRYHLTLVRMAIIKKSTNNK